MLSVLSGDSILRDHRLRRRHRRPLAHLRSSRQTSAEAADGPRPPIVTKEPWALLVIFEAASRAFEDYRDMDGRIRFADRESRNGGVITACLTCLQPDTLRLCHQGKSRRPAAMLAPLLPPSKVLHSQTTTTSLLPIGIFGPLPRIFLTPMTTRGLRVPSI